MPKVLTENGRCTCPHQGAVSLSAGQNRLLIDGGKALVQGDTLGAGIPAVPPPGPGRCTVLTDPNTGAVSCTATISELPGAATRLTVDGVPVLLETVTGQTNGTGTPPSPPPSQSWSTDDPGQSRMESE
ncbi:MAG: hypothetical protein ACOCXJ_02485 [Planctomycetota bacterium]